MGEPDKILYCQIVAQIIIADAAITDDEHAFLHRLMDRLGLDAAGKSAVFGGVDYGGSVDEKVARLAPELRPQLMDELQAAAGADGSVERREQAILDAVQAALFFSR